MLTVARLWLRKTLLIAGLDGLVEGGKNLFGARLLVPGDNGKPAGKGFSAARNTRAISQSFDSGTPLVKRRHLIGVDGGNGTDASSLGVLTKGSVRGVRNV